MNKVLQLYCDFCNWKKITDVEGLSQMFEIKQSSIQTNIPVLDPVTKKIKLADDMLPKRKFRCQKCGRPVPVRVIADTQKNIEAAAALKIQQEKEKELNDLAILKKDSNEKNNRTD